jgi:L-ascorbate metabolism protein UlaG (beta-lactamase superfamily)
MTAMAKRRAALGRWLWRAVRAGAALFALALVVACVDGWRAFGHRAVGPRRARVAQSPQWRDGRFHNPQPLENSAWRALTGAFQASPVKRPPAPVPVVRAGGGRFATAPASGLRVTWLGHSTLLIEIDGRRVLTDPVWSDRASPFGWAGPLRWYAPPVALDELPPLDAVLISHDHYDHLDQHTVAALAARGTTFVVPLGVGAHLAYWGVPEARIVELDWWDRAEVGGGLAIVCTPARHASGRMIVDNDAKLWAGYALVGPRHRVYFSGDTGLFPAMREVGARLGPFDLTMIEAGQYDPAWPDWHIGPEQAVRAHQTVRGRLMLPIHWGLFTLAYHGWTEPAERVLAAASAAGARVVIPRPGQSIEPASPPPFERWWPQLPWRTARETPVVSTKVGE